jgi:serine protease Do
MKIRKPEAWASTGLAALAAAGLLSGAAWVNADQSQKAPLASLTPQQQEAIDSAHHLSSAFRTVAEELLPSVVSIENRPAVASQWNSQAKPQPSQGGMRGENPFRGTPFEDMFRGMERGGPNMSPGRSAPAPQGGIGSGVIIDSSGVILTNNHVVAGGGEVTVRTHDGREFVATNVWTDPKTDLAVVKVDASGLAAATLGDSDRVSIGDWVMALGQPFGLESTVTAGIISAKHRGIGITARENFLQTDAAINPGNSGGPLVNLRGEVVGINTAIHSRSGGNEGIGFAVPSNLARWVGDQLVDSGTVKRAYLGVGIQPVTPELAKELKVKPRGGVIVTDVYPNTPAAKAGLESGDVIVRFGKNLVSTPQALQLAVERSPFGEELVIEIVRSGKNMKLGYEAAMQPTDFGTSKNEEQEQPGKRMEGLGLEIAPLDAAVAKQLGMEGTEGVVITSVREKSPASEVGLAPGIVIREVNRQKVNSVADFERLMAEHRKDASAEGILLLVRSEKGSRFVVVNS